MADGVFKKVRFAGLMSVLALAIVACSPTRPVESQESSGLREIACPPGEAQIQCIKDALKACQNPRVMAADTNRAENLTEFSEITADRPISEETIRQRPTLIICEGPEQ